MKTADLKKSLFKFYNSEDTYFSLIESESTLETEERDRVLGFIPDNAKVLDVACGCCRYADYLAKRLYGVDVSLIGLNRASKKYRDHIRLAAADVANLPYKDDVFDVVMTTYSLEHFVEPEKVLKEMYRVCKKGTGRLIIISSAWEEPSHLPPSIEKDLNSHPILKYIFIINRFFRYLALMYDKKKVFFKTIKNPAVLEDKFTPDNDAVYIVNIREVVNFFNSLPVKVLYLKRVIRKFKQPFLANFVYNLKTLIKNNPYRKYFGTRLFIVIEKD